MIDDDDGSGLLLLIRLLVGAFPFSRSCPLLLASWLVLMSGVAPLLLRLTSAPPRFVIVSVVSFSFCFILTAVIVGTSRGFAGTVGSRCFDTANGARFPVFIVGDMPLLPTLLLLPNERSLPLPPLDVAIAAAFKRWWWLSSLMVDETLGPPADWTRSLPSAAARSLEDLVVRIGCCGCCCCCCCCDCSLTCCC